MERDLVKSYLIDVISNACLDGVSPECVADFCNDEKNISILSDKIKCIISDFVSGNKDKAEYFEWNSRYIGKFWDFLSKTPLVELSFSRSASDYLLNFLRMYLLPGGRHLDYGAGEGHLARLLSANGFPTALYEPSSQRLMTAQASMDGTPGSLGVVDAGDPRFDVILMIEVIEHILDGDMAKTLEHLNDLLSTDGTLIITTPNEEVLEHNFCCDPVSGRLFHRWQHVRSFSRDSLTDLLDRHGFEAEVVHAVEFSPRIFDDAGGGGLKNSKALSNILNSPRPLVIGDGRTLVYIGHRKGSGRGGSWREANNAWVKQPLLVAADTHLRVVGTPQPGAATIPVPSEAMRWLGGHAWWVSFADLGLEEAQTQPIDRVRIFENMLPLGPLQDGDAVITGVGRGRFCVRQDGVCFSSSDNSQPTHNGRDYFIAVVR